MGSLSDFFVNFPDQTDPDFNLHVTAKQEFQELDHEGMTNGLFNNQEFVVRMMSPGTGMRRLFMDSYMGTGKTRPPYIIMEQYKGIMNNIPLIIINGDVVRAVHNTEIQKLSKTVLSTTEINRRYEFVHYTSFSNKIATMLATKGGREQVIREYGNRVIFADEIHYLRDIKEEGAKNKKKTYSIMHEFFHIVMDSSVIILATGTSKMDSAAEISIINLILEQDRQINIEQIKSVVRNTTDLTWPKMVKYFKRYFTGVLFYITLDPSTMPPSVTLGERYKVSNSSLGVEDQTREPVVVHKMREYQNTIYNNIEADIREKVGGRSLHSLSYALAFVFPPATTKDGKKLNVIRFQDYAVSYIKDSTASTIGKIRDDIEPLRKWSLTLSNIDKVKNHSIKYGNILEELLADPTRQAFIGFPYVKMGVVMFGILLEKQGYKYYNANKPLIPTKENKAKRYTIISEDTSTTKMKYIEEAANMVENKYGEYLHVILGSPRSGVGLSFTNARRMDMTRGTWHKGQEDQFRARVFRANSLLHFDKNDKENYNIISARHAVISEDFPYSKDVEMYFVSDKKSEQIAFVDRAEASLAMNTAISSYRNKNEVDPIYKNLKRDYSSYMLGGYSAEIEKDIESHIKLIFIQHPVFEVSKVEGFPLPVVRRVAERMVDSSTLVRDRWGRQQFIKSNGKGLFFLQDGYTIGDQETLPHKYQLGNKIFHERDSSIFSFIRPSTLKQSFLKFLDDTKGMKADEFIDSYLHLFVEIKIVSLEMLLVNETSEDISVRRKKLILKTMKNNWFVIPEMKCVVHILDQINIDRVHYTANVSNIENTGKLRIYCYDDESPAWRFVTDNEVDPIITYINDARRENESYYSSKSDVYGIINTTDNNFRIYDASDRSEEPKDKKRKKEKEKELKESENKNSTATGYICMDKKKQAMIPLLWRFKIQAPDYIKDEFKGTKMGVMKKTVQKTQGVAIPPGATDEFIEFAFYWLKTSIKKDICPALRNYFQENDLLFIK